MIILRRDSLLLGGKFLHRRRLEYKRTSAVACGNAFDHASDDWAVCLGRLRCTILLLVAGIVPYLCGLSVNRAHTNPLHLVWLCGCFLVQFFLWYGSFLGQLGNLWVYALSLNLRVVTLFVLDSLDYRPLLGGCGAWSSTFFAFKQRFWLRLELQPGLGNYYDLASLAAL